MKIFITGLPGSGRQPFVECLTDNPSQDKNDCGLEVYHWNALPDKNGESGKDLEDYQIEIWDWSGKKYHNGIQTIFITSGTVVLYLISLDDHVVLEEVLRLWLDVRMKNQRLTILTVFITKETGESRNVATLKRICEELIKSIDALLFKVKDKTKTETSSNRQETQEPKLYNLLQHWKTDLQFPGADSSRVFQIKTRTREGILRLNKELRRLHSTQDIQKCDIKTEVIKETISNMKIKNVILLKTSDMTTVLRKSGSKDVNSVLRYMLSQDMILRFEFDDGSDYVTLDPPSLAKVLCSLHFENHTKTFRIEAGRFWPKDSGCDRPQPEVVVKLLEDVPKLGIVRETLIPIIWQEANLSEEQILYCLSLMELLGLAFRCHGKHQDDILPLPYFDRLSPNGTYCLTLMEKFPNNRPTINWTPLPLPGDISICIRHKCIYGLPNGFLSRLIGRCKHVTMNIHHYSYIWAYGVLLRLDEVMLCIEGKDGVIEVSGRLDPSVYSTTEESIQNIWIVMSTVLSSVESLFEEYSLIPRKTSVTLGGDTFYEEVPNSKVTEIPVEDFFSTAISSLTRQSNAINLIPFDDIPKGCTFKDWLRLLAPKINTLLPQKSIERKRNPSNTKSIRNKVKKNLAIKWNLDDSGIEKTREGRKPQTNSTLKENNRKMTKIHTNIENQNRGAGFGCHGEQSEDLVTEMIQKIASSFVAVTIARGLAKYIEENERPAGVFTKKQVLLAKATAEASNASLVGDSSTVANVVQRIIDVDVSKSDLHDASSKSDRHLQSNVKGKSPLFSKSKVCIVM